MATPARADVEAWSSFELRLPLADSPPGLDRASFRLVSETRLRGRSGGLGQMLLRPGLRLDVADWFFLVMQPALYLERGDVGEFLQGVRAEVEPTFRFEVGSFEISDRNRIAYRWETDDITWYYRSMLRLQYDAGGLRPFLWAEPLLELRGSNIDEWRVMGGVQLVFSESSDLDVGYLLRSREENDGSWSQDHIAGFFFVFDGWE